MDASKEANVAPLSRGGFETIQLGKALVGCPETRA
jgi:hypothetical protein